MNLKNILLILVIFLTVVVTKMETGFEETVSDCTVKDHLPCTLHIVKGPRACLEQTILKPLLPHLYTFNDSTGRPGNPKNVAANVYPVRVNGSLQRLPYVNLTVTPPTDSSIEEVRGFQIILRDFNNDCTAIIADLWNATWKEPGDYSTTISLGPLPLEEDTEYHFRAMSLRNPDRLSAFRADIPKYKYPDAGAECEWTTKVMVNVSNVEGRVEVSFIKAPAVFNFKQYKVTLVDIIAFEQNANSYDSILTDKDSYNFTSVKPSRYQVQVTPHDPEYSSMDASKCACPAATLSYCCRCKDSTSEHFNVSEVPRLQEATAYPVIPEPDVTWIVGVAIGSVSGFLVIVTATCCLLKRRQRHIIEILSTSGTHQPEPKSNESLSRKDEGGRLKKCESMGSFGMECDDITVIRFHSQEEDKRIVPVKMKLFLAYEEKEDDPYRHLIDSFATYLQSRCCCDVMCVPWTLEAEWVLVELEKANFLVLFDSDSAFNRYWNSKHSAPIDSFQTANSIFSKLMLDGGYQENIITVHFSGANQCRSLRELGFGSHFGLMEELTEFLCKVHSIPTLEKYDKFRLPKRHTQGRNGFYGNDEEERELFECAQTFSNSNTKTKGARHSKTRKTHDSGFGEVDGSQYLNGLEQRDKLTDFYLNTYLDTVSHGVITIPANVGISSSDPTHLHDNHVFHIQVDRDCTTAQKGQAKADTYQQIPSDMYSFCAPEEIDDISMTLSSQMVEVNKNYFRYKDGFF